MTTDLPFLFALSAVMAAMLASIAVWAPRPLLVKLGALGCAGLFLPLGYLGLSDLMSRPKPVALEWWMGHADEATVLGSQMREGDGLYLWLQVAGVPEPRAYRLPWDQKMAEQLQKALAQLKPVFGGGGPILNTTGQGAGLGGGSIMPMYGIVFRDVAMRESLCPPWRELVNAFRRMEARGEIRGGRFVSGFAGEQFALPEAVDLSGESAATLTAYGLDQDDTRATGRICLLARRLVEAGVPWLTVFFNHGIRGQDAAPTETDEYGWDTHNDIFEAMRDHLLPRFDLGFSALLEDLEQRGLLETTLVVCLGEFGRAPLVALEPRFDGSSPGRKHWAACYSIVLAGAGITPGAIYGASDKMGAYPSLNPVSPGDLLATMYSALGINHTDHFHDLANRPVPLTTGQPIKGLFA